MLTIVDVSRTVTQANNTNQASGVRNTCQQAGNGSLTQARSGLASSIQDVSRSDRQRNDILTQDFNSLGEALHSSKITEAQNAFTTLSKDLQQSSGYGYHYQPGAAAAVTQQSNPIAQAFEFLGKSLQSGDLSIAQQAYAAILRDLQQFGLNVNAISSASAASQTPGSNFYITA